MNNIEPEHYRTGKIDLFEEWYLTYPFDQFRAIMQSHAEKYLRRNKVDRVEDLDKCMETIRRLKEYEEKESEKVRDKGVSVLWADNEPTKISKLLEYYENGGENGKVEKEPLYYAKIKGWEVLGKRSHWIYLKKLKKIYHWSIVSFSYGNRRDDKGRVERTRYQRNQR